jgi:hypothetical protein
MRSTAGVVREYTLKRQNILDNFKYAQMNLNLDQKWRLQMQKLREQLTDYEKLS